MSRTLAAALVTLAVSGALACAAPAARAGPLDSLAFMAGSWVGGDSLDREEEHWTAPRGGLMVGMHRDLRGGRARNFEFFRIEERNGALWYLTQPGGRPAVAFRASEVSANRVMFENLAHDFPQRILYWRERPGELRARIEGPGKDGTRSRQWTWTAGALAP